MNIKKFENVRFTPKGDIEANWNKAIGFIPLDKEIIIYKADAAHPVARFKIGDGVTPVQDLDFSGADMVAIEQLVDEKGDLLIEYVDNAVKDLISINDVQKYVNDIIQPLENKNNEQDEKIVVIEKKIIIATKDNILSIF